MTRPYASLSLDLDDLWTYMKTHGDAGWESFPSYLDRLVPIVLDEMRAIDAAITVFVVGNDASLDRNHAVLRSMADEGHEIGNHSFMHEPWLHRYGPAQLDDEIGRAGDAIEGATGRRPVGFRGPGFSCSNRLLEVLERRGYAYDASTLPTWIGPVARAYYFRTAKLSSEDRRERSALFGSWKDAVRSNRPYLWDVGDGLVEIPVTVAPVARVPFHLSYVLYLAMRSRLAARAYFRGVLRACRVMGVRPSVLLHPLDFLGGDEVKELDFFPAMRMPGERKRELVRGFLADLARGFAIVTMREHASRARSAGLRTRSPDLVEGAGPSADAEMPGHS